MKRTRGSRRRAHAPRRPDFCRLNLQTLEDRLPPGDALLGAVLGAWLGDTSGRTPTSRTPELALAGSLSWFQVTNELPATTAAAQPAPEAAPTPVTVQQSNPAESATQPTSRQSDGDLRPPAPNASPLTFRSPEAATADHALPVAASGGSVTAPSTGLTTSAPASVGSQPAVAGGGTAALNSPAALSFLSLLNPLGSTRTATQPSIAAAPGQSGQLAPNHTAIQVAPLAAPAPVNAAKVAAACTAQQSTADPWGGDPRTIAPLHANTANGPSSCATAGTGTDQGAPPPGGGTPVNVLVNDPNEDGNSANDTHSETTLAVDGTNVMVSFNDSFLANHNPQQYTGYAYSSDQGDTFTDGGGLPVNPAGDLGDPVLAHDNQTGRTYLATLSFGTPLHIWRSDNDLHTIMAPVNGAPGRGGLDKEWLAVDNYAGTGQGNVYLVIRDFSGGNGIYLFRSTDQGATFGPNGGILIASGAGGNVQGAWVTVGPDHTVYALWYDNTTNPATIKIRKSTDQGQTFGNAVTITTLSNTLSVNGDLGLTGIRVGTTTPAPFRSNAFPQAVVNPANGNIYVTFDNRGTGGANDRADVFFTQSTDSGATWSTPVKVNDGPVGRAAWQPALAVNPSGSRIGIFWYDRRNDSADNLIDRYGALGTVAGNDVIFDPNIRISDTSFPPEFGRDPAINPVYMGDYDMAVADSSYFYLTWGDNRTASRGHTGNRQDVRFAKILQIVAGPSVVAATPTGVTFGNVNSMRVTFDEEINPKTFTPDKVLFLNPAGGQVAVTDVQPVDGSGNRRFDLSFANQTTLGTYTMIIGPDIEDTNGNQMDQDHDGIPGEVPQDEYVARFTLTPPRITDSTPAFGAILTPQALGKVTVTFNEPMNPATFTPAKVTTFVGPHGSIPVTAVTPVSGSNNTKFDITYAAQGFTGYYNMVVGPNIQDTAGHSMDQPYSLYFGLQGPRITTNPQLGTFNPGQTTSVRVAFNEAMNPATFTPSTATLTGPEGPVTITSVTPVTGNMQFDIHFAALTTAGLYHLTVGPHIRDTFGNEMDQNNNLITGEDPGDQYNATLNVRGPFISSQIPATGGSGLPPQAISSIQVTFNEAIDPASFTADKIASFSRVNGAVVTDLSSTITTIVPDASHTRFTINFTSTGATGRYIMVIGPDIHDTFGNEMDQNQNGIPGEIPGDQYTAFFTLLGPRIISSSPSGSVPAQLVSSVQVGFNEAMNPATFTRDQVVSFTRTNGTQVTHLEDQITGIVPIAGSNNTRFSINFNGTGMIGQYSLVIGPHIRDTFGNEMDQDNNLILGEDPGDRFNATFTLLGPRVTFSSPTGTISGQVNSVRLNFNEAMDPTTFTPDKVSSFTGPDGPIDVTGIFPVAGNTQFDVTFAPQVKTGRYTMVVGPDVEDYFGNEMDQNQNGIAGEIPGDQYIATFGISGPRIISSTPTGNANPPGVDHVRVTFDRAMDPSTFTPDKVASFKGPGGVDIPVTGVAPVPFTGNTQFDISCDPLGTIGSYTIVVGPDIHDLYGNAMDQNGNLIPGEVPGDQYTATFGVTGPVITATNPANNGTSFTPLDHVQVTFSAPMDASTFTPDKVTSFMGPHGNAIPVNDVQEMSSSNHTQFNILFDAQTDTGRYTMVIGPGIHDLFGNSTTGSFNLAFNLVSPPGGSAGSGSVASIDPYRPVRFAGSALAVLAGSLLAPENSRPAPVAPARVAADATVVKVDQFFTAVGKQEAGLAAALLPSGERSPAVESAWQQEAAPFGQDDLLS
jgi:hypothetical protein